MMSFTEAVGGASSSASVCLGLCLQEHQYDPRSVAGSTHLELSNIESIPKSDTEPPEKVWLSFAFVGTIGGSSRGPPGGDDYNGGVNF